MQLSKNEAGALNYALKTKTDERGNVVGRQLEIDEQEAGLSIVRKLKTLIADDKFVDGEVEDFTTEEKALVLKLCKRPWGADDLESKESLCEKLK